jgi:glycosyltransferase involved in cell wall biosynthesis
MVGGVESFVLLLARGLSERPDLFGGKLLLTLVTEAQREGFPDHPLPFRVVRQPTYWQLWRMVRGADLVQLAGPCFLPLLMALILRKPVVIEQHGYQAVCPNGSIFHHPSQQTCPGHFLAGNYLECLRCNAVTDGWLRSLRMLLLNFPRLAMCRRATLHLPISQHVQQRLGFARSQVIYYGIEDPLTTSVAVPDPSFSSGPICFAYVGRLVSEKGIPLLLEAAAELKRLGRDFRVKIVGDGPERPRLERLVHGFDLRDRVEFTGFVRGAALEAALADVVAVVMPTICEETAGLSAIEQMMRARLVIVSDIGGLGEVVGDAGLKFAAGGVRELTICMLRVLEDHEILRQLGPRARERAMQLFQVARMTEEYAAVYRRLLG